jgi:hypothetical protein
MRRVIVAEWLLLCVAFFAGVFFVYRTQSPPPPLDELNVRGHVLEVDCMNHSRVAYEYQYLGRSYSQVEAGDCERLRPGQDVSVWFGKAHPNWGSLTDLNIERRSSAQTALSLLLFFGAAVGLGVLRLLPRVFPNGRLARGPWDITNWPWPRT